MAFVHKVVLVSSTAAVAEQLAPLLLGVVSVSPLSAITGAPVNGTQTEMGDVETWKPATYNLLKQLHLIQG